MSPELHEMIQLLKSQLGYSEHGGGYTKFGDWYGKTVEFDSDYSAQPWCDMFLSWAAHKLGYDEWFGQFAYTVGHAEWFISHDAWGDTPEPGAVVFYDWSGAGEVDGIDHVGMVIDVDGDTIHTIEGNVDGQFVREKTRDQDYVVGYGYPDQVKAQQEAEAMASAPAPAPAPGVAKAVHAAHTAAPAPAQPAPVAHPVSDSGVVTAGYPFSGPGAYVIAGVPVSGPGASGVAAAGLATVPGEAMPGYVTLLVPLLVALLAVVACVRARRTRRLSR
ncbi:CHAP domain-containing protein [Sphaerisporangium aureirubrum]|uniref:CHAP domain-containing protein n=1 Tax=Sphaerisporangium aureirubrum TaxID=1544736 RepID=A0ABW1NQ77_9ACTN